MSERVSIRVQSYEQADKIYVVSITFSENRSLNTDIAGKTLAEIAPKVLDVFKKAALKAGLPEHVSRLKITTDEELAPPKAAAPVEINGQARVGVDVEKYRVNEDGTTTVVEDEPPQKKFYNEDGTEQPMHPMTMGMNVQAKFSAQIIRDGKVVED